MGDECTSTDLSISPKKVWERTREIEKGYSGHHKNVIPQHFANAAGEISSSDKENADATHAHFQSIFDTSDATVDETILDDIGTLSIDDVTLSNIKNPPTNKEVENVIYKMKNGTAAGITGVTSDMLKNLPQEAIHYKAESIHRNWSNQHDCTDWHTTTLSVLYKGKGKQCDLNN